MLDTSRFRDADKYALYLRTPAGRLRSELAWENLRRFLPRDGAKRRALDLGGGTGFASVQLARLGFGVVLLDASEEMLEMARQQAEVAGAAARISFRHAEAAQLTDLFDPGYFDVVVCHNLLEYVEDSSATVRDTAGVLARDGVLSVLVRNRFGEVLKAAIKSRDWKLATANLSAETVVDSLFREPLRVFDPAELRDILARAGLDVVTERGVRIFFDYLGLESLTDDAYREVFELESALGARQEFFSIARYIQVIARPSRASSSKETGR